MTSESNSPLVALVRYSYNMTGSEEVNQYTTDTRPVVSEDEGSFTPLPMGFEFGKMTGRADVESVEITSKLVSPVSDYLEEGIFAPITVDIWTCDPTDVDATLHREFHGTLIRLLANPQGHPGLAKIEAANVWHRCKSHPLGLSATTRCPWKFGDDHMCKVDVEALIETVTISSVAGKAVTVSSVADSSDVWSSGYLRRGDLAIGIKDFDGADTFTLAEPPPSSWAAAVDLQAVPGCNKTIDQCRSRWDNESQFGGFGIAIPAEDPRTFG